MRPPALAGWLMRVSLPRADRDAVMGDLHEEFAARSAAGGARAARRWYRAQVARSLGYSVRQRFAWLRPDGAAQDVKYAVRSLAATPTFTVVALVVLTLGIGSTTAIFSVVDGVALRGLPYWRGDRLIKLSEPPTNTKHGSAASVAAADFEDWRAGQRTFEDLAAVQGSPQPFVVRDGDGAHELRAAMVSASFFPLLHAQPSIGRALTRDDEVARERVAILSDACWRGRFAADPQIVGKTLTVENGAWTIVGVMPPSFTYPPAAPMPIDVWTPYVPIQSELSRGDGTHRSSHAEVIGRLREGVSLSAARADIERITGQIKQQTPLWFRDRWVALTPLQDAIVGPVKSWMLMLLGAVAFVLLIACVNVANLLLARAASRSRDAAVRSALGASRSRIMRTRLAESLVLSLAGTVLGLALASWAVSILRASLPASLPRLDEVAINYRVLAAAAFAAVAVAIGVTPVWQGSRGGLDGALRQGRTGTGGGVRHRIRIGLLVAEVALAGVLLIGSALFISSFVGLVRVDLGFTVTNLVSVNLSQRGRVKGKDGVFVPGFAQGVTAVFERARQLPGVEKAALVAGSPPLDQGDDRTSVTVAGAPTFGGDDSPDDKSVTPEYFAVFRVPLVAGRVFSDADVTPGAPRVLMLNDIAAARYFPGANPIGAELRVGRDPSPFTIVGVVRAVRLQGPEAELRPEMYRPLDWRQPQGSPVVTLVARTAGGAAALVPTLRAAIQSAAPGLVLPEAQTYETLFAKIVAQQKFNMYLLAIFGVLAISIAAAGIYGVMAYMVEQRTQEIGVRIALGAEPAAVVRMVLAQAVACLAAGLGVAMTAGWMLSRFVQGFLFRVDARDPRVYAAAAAVLLAAGIVAALVPARRAARVDPLVALRSL